jgi:hypothetical protein
VTSSQEPENGSTAGWVRRFGSRRIAGVAVAMALSAGLASVTWISATSAPEQIAGAQALNSSASSRQDTSTSASSTPPSSVTPNAASSPRVTASPGESPAEVATNVVETYVKAFTALPTDTANLDSALGSLAGETVRAEIAAQLLELDANGWTREGTPTVASLTVVTSDPDGTPPTLSVVACIDSSDVVLKDSAGEAIQGGPQPRRALNTYVLQQNDDGSWIIVSHSFPNDPAC